jgi:hypothetical protein
MKVTPSMPNAAQPPRRFPESSVDVEDVKPAPAVSVDQLAFTGPSGLKEGASVLVERVRAALAQRDRGLPKVRNLEAALNWAPGSEGLSGTAANATINRTYHALSDAFTDFLGEPALPNWMTFGQYASREVGTQINSLEDAFSALHSVGHPQTPREIYQALDEAMEHLSPEMAKQVLKLTRSQIERPTIKDLIALGANPALGVTREVVELLDDTMAALDRLHKALVQGNVGIYANMAPAYQVFLKAEEAGEDGLEALRQNGYQAGGEKDPQGFIEQAFSRYQMARELGDQAKYASATERGLLLDERRQLIHEANLFIGIQEQMVILQAPGIYGDPEVANVVNAQGELSLTDAAGTHRLVGNWADFATRMGLEVVPDGTAGAFPIRDHAGKSTAYRIPDPPVAGTITAYFAAGLAAGTAGALLNGEPRPF